MEENDFKTVLRDFGFFNKSNYIFMAFMFVFITASIFISCYYSTVEKASGSFESIHYDNGKYTLFINTDGQISRKTFYDGYDSRVEFNLTRNNESMEGNTFSYHYNLSGLGGFQEGSWVKINLAESENIEGSRLIYQN